MNIYGTFCFLLIIEVTMGFPSDQNNLTTHENKIESRSYHQKLTFDSNESASDENKIRSRFWVTDDDLATIRNATLQSTTRKTTRRTTTKTTTPRSTTTQRIFTTTIEHTAYTDPQLKRKSEQS